MKVLLDIDEKELDGCLSGQPINKYKFLRSDRTVKLDEPSDRSEILAVQEDYLKKKYPSVNEAIFREDFGDYAFANKVFKRISEDRAVSYGAVDDELIMKYIDMEVQHVMAQEKETAKTIRRLDDSVRDWYIRQFPSDELGKDIEPVTFKDVIKSFGSGVHLDEVIGVYDSILRDRVLVETSYRSCIPYENIWDAMVGNKPLKIPSSKAAVR